VDQGKVVSHKRTKVGQWASRIDESDQQLLATELAQVDCSPVLILQLEIWHWITWRRNMVRDGRSIVRLGLRDNNNMVKKHGGVCILRNQYISGNHVARMQFAQNA